MKRVPFVKAYPGVSLHLKITNRGIMEETHRLCDLGMDYDRAVKLRTKNVLGIAKHTKRYMDRRLAWGI